MRFFDCLFGWIYFGLKLYIPLLLYLVFVGFAGTWSVQWLIMFTKGVISNSSLNALLMILAVILFLAWPFMIDLFGILLHFANYVFGSVFRNYKKYFKKS